mmetsp:Transcript_43818/g.115750  ORF Transcript_43818/g.115750 Transcript_43818/m.115750 type:complete len:219 (+) Transcript_43818:223-879(+)
MRVCRISRRRRCLRRSSNAHNQVNTLFGEQEIAPLSDAQGLDRLSKAILAHLFQLFLPKPAKISAVGATFESRFAFRTGADHLQDAGCGLRRPHAVSTVVSVLQQLCQSASQRGLRLLPSSRGALVLDGIQRLLAILVPHYYVPQSYAFHGWLVFVRSRTLCRRVRALAQDTHAGPLEEARDYSAIGTALVVTMRLQRFRHNLSRHSPRPLREDKADF